MGRDAFRLGQLPPLQFARTRHGRLAYVLSGRARPSIVLLNGAGVTLEGWRALYPRIESLGRVLAFNRFGVAGSDGPLRAQTGLAVADALADLLAQTRLAAPYLLVGHSLGGLFANLFARLHPHQVAGVLLLEATHPDDHVLLRRHETPLARALSSVLSLPQRLFRANLHSEIEWVDASVRELARAGPFPDVPVTVVTGGQPPPAWMMSPAAAGARRAHQQDLARLSPQGEQVIAQASGHFPQLTEPGLVLEALRRLVARVRVAEPAP